MNTLFLLMSALTSALPASDDPSGKASPFEAAIRAQGPGYQYEEVPPLQSPGAAVIGQPYVPMQPFGSIEPVTGIGLYAGFEFVFVKPYFSSDPAFVFSKDRDGGGLADSVEYVQFDWDMDVSPRFWVGYVSQSGLGVQVRYWTFDDTAEESARDAGLAPGSNYGVDFLSGTRLSDGVTIGLSTTEGDRIEAEHGIDLDVLDAEGTWRKGYDWGSVTVTGGVRVASLDQEYEARVITPGGDVESTVRSNHDFEGAGPTISLFGRRRLGMSNFAPFANGRFSALYGEERSKIREVSSVTSDPDFNEAWSEENDTLMPVTELQLGIDWTTPLWGSTQLFLRAGLEGQVWFDAGTAMANIDSDSPAGDDSNLGFFGFVFGGGLSF